MAPNITAFVLFWMLSASYTAESRSEQHPLCRTLGDGEHRHKTQFPSAYTCHSDDDDAICTLTSMEITDTSASKEERGGVTWWVYQGRRASASDDLRDDAWLDCTNYHAQRSPVPGPGKRITDSPRARHGAVSEHITATGGDLGEPRPSAVNGRTGTLSLYSRGLRNLQEDDPRGSAGVDINLGAVGMEEENERINPDEPRTRFVYNADTTCNNIWLSWPAMQERAIARGTFVVFDVIASVGNLFYTLQTLMKFIRLLDLGLILKWTDFPGFRVAFNPAAINWDLDAGQLMQQMDFNEKGVNAAGLHLLEFRNFAMVLCDSQLEMLALTINVSETNTQVLASKLRKNLPDRMNPFMSHVMRKPLTMNTALDVQPCTWNMLLSRSDSMIASLKHYRPWSVVNDASRPRHQNAEYVAWHVRTADGETDRSYHPAVHKYVVRELSSNVCPTYLAATKDALHLTKACRASLSEHADDQLVYLSSNSKQMARNCTMEASNHDIVMGHVEMGLKASDVHTAHSHYSLEPALGAFLDFFFLLDSTVIVRTGSSFSGSACKIKGLKCVKKVYDTLPERRMFLCLPSDCT